MWCSGSKSAKEIGAIFGVNPNTLETRASRERWKDLRARVLEEKMALESRSGPARVPNPYAIPARSPDGRARNPERARLEVTVEEIETQKRARATAKVVAQDKVIMERALAIADSTKFRDRVIAVNEKALKVLEQNEPTSVGEVDRFAEALTKVERIGARTYGYDREAERPVINIGVLTSGPGSEYD
jgi:hypothetical protein